MARRSVLFSPGDRPDLLRKAPTVGADVIVFDLEDAVASAQRDEARESVRAALDELAAEGTLGSGRPEVCVRVNPPGRGTGTDLDAILNGPAPDGLVVPKVSAAADVTDVAAMAAERGGDPPILALVETASGILEARAVAAADPTDALVFGAEDLAADLGATRTDEGHEVLYAREHVVLAAAAADVDAIDTVYTDFEDERGLRRETAVASEMGYDGKLAIHPDQVDPINETFTPDPERVEWARRVLAAREEAGDRGVFEVDGEMVDPPVVTQAERVRDRALAADRW